MLDLAIAVSDRPVRPDQYRYVETHAWWLGTFGLHHYLSEQRLRQWVPAHPDRDLVLERELTGAHTWLTGSAAVVTILGALAADVVAEAIVRGVRAATGVAGWPAVRDL